MKVKYVGPHDAVDLAVVGKVKRGDPVEVSAALAKSLLEQEDNWQAAATTKPRTPQAADENTAEE